MRIGASWRRAVATTAVLAVGLGVVGHAHGDGVGLVVTSKSIPEATVEVIDPESGTSSGGGTTDVRLAAGDIILFRFNFFPVPDKQIHGLNGWLTEYIPSNTEVVGVRLIDDDGSTVLPRYPGIASDDCGSGCNGYDSVPTSGGTRNLDDGSISQLYADTGVFYTTDSRLQRNPSMQFITLANGTLMDPPPNLVSQIDGTLNTSAPYYAHNPWDWAQVRAFGISNSNGNFSGNGGGGNTPYGYGSPVAGPETHYQYEATEVSSSPAPLGQIEFNDVVGPWNRIQYPRSLIGTGSPATTSGTEPTRTVLDASTIGHDLTPGNPLPSSATALRFALGEIRVGEPVNVEVALRVLDTPIDGIQGADVDCGEAFGGDTSARSATGRADDNPWPFYLGSPACVFLNLLFDLTADKDLAAGAGDNIEFTLRTKNLSLNAQDNVWIRQKYDSSRVSLSATTPFPDMAPTCTISDCDGDGLDCLYWGLGTMTPSEEVAIRTNFEASGGGQNTHVMRADYTSATLGTVSGNPCGAGAVSNPGFRTQKINMLRTIGIVEAELATTTVSAAPGGSADLSGEVRVRGTNNVGIGELNPQLPAGWTVSDSNSNGLPDINFNGTIYECDSGCTTNTPVFDGIGVDLDPTTGGGVDSGALSFAVDVPAGETSDLYDIDLQVWGSQTAFGGSYETYFPDIATVPVGAPRSTPPVVSCPVLSTETSISGTWSGGADGECAVIRVYLNGIERGSATSDPSAGGTASWTVSGFGRGTSFGELYGGLEVRATAARDVDCDGTPEELESEKSLFDPDPTLSDSCFVDSARECSDGIDNDGDGFTDFPADDGCSSATDPREDTVECSDGIDNDGDGAVDYPDDPGCFAAYDGDEGDSPACSDGIDNDGDGDIDVADADCVDANDRTEVTLAACMNGIDDDGDGLIDNGNDPGCHSDFDDDEVDPAVSTDDIRARMLVVFDTSGSMNWNTCNDTFTGGDGSDACSGGDVDCGTCSATGCGDGIANDSRLFKAKRGLSDVVAAFGEVEYSLMRFHQRMMEFDCPGTNASLQSGTWQGAGADCGGGFSAGDLLVDFSQENPDDVIAWMDGSSNYPGAEPPPGLDRELRGTGTTPLAGSLDSARNHLEDVKTTDGAATCRPYSVILLTDGIETCGGDPTTAAADLQAAGYDVYVIGFAVSDPDPSTPENEGQDALDAIASSGGTGSAIFVDDETALSAELAGIIGETILVETCNGTDDDCDGLVDEGFTLYCDRPSGHTAQDLCGDPGETVCDGVDDNCNGEVDEGLLNACGECGAVPEEVCDSLDNDCDGVIDEDNVCDGCIVEPEICDGLDNDCDGVADEDLTRACGTDVGECTIGTETCNTGTWGSCTGITPTTETCDGLDNDCDGTVDGITQECGESTGACEPGTELCTGGTWGSCTGGIGPSTEVCDNIDNDCDGSVDEGLTRGCTTACGTGTEMCTAGSWGGCDAPAPSTEVCDGIDNDCDGTVDDGVTRTCSSVCGDGTEFCSAGSWGGCTAPSPTTEVCDGDDNDCDGTVDEGLTRSCSNECGSGTETCSAGSWGGCTAPTPETEVCDNVDNDCDGTIDDGVTRECSNECGTGTEFCSAGSWGGCTAPTPETEVCDNEDNDCDGTIDEDVTRECSNECGTGTEICSSGTWGACDAPSGEPEVCDGADNDCDGEIDEDVTRECSNACGTGTEFCSDGSWGGCTAPTPEAEVCDGEDNDCDGTVDDFTRDCSTICGDGTQLCTDGTWGDCSAPEPTEEICDGEDNDCDGEVDDGIPVGGPCGSDVGECEPGRYVCVDGDPEGDCVGGVGPTEEVCDTLDNDCDGAVDADDPDLVLRGTCDTEGVCEPGVRQCVDGSEVCVGAVPEEPEICDCEDNDCDGEIDEPPDSGRSLCPGESVCKDCQCVVPCSDSEFGPCPSGRIATDIDGECFCVADTCEEEACAGMTVERDGEVKCAPDTSGVPECTCDGGVCTFPCDGVVCADPLVCDPRDGRCKPDDCTGLGCPEGQICNTETLECEEHPCAGVECAADEACRDGSCEPSCATADCADDQRCESGVCIEDLCAGVSCDTRQVCDPATGDCVEDMCRSRTCPEGTVCDPVTGTCPMDPCSTVICPGSQVCEDGECVLDDTPTEDAGMPEEDGGMVEDDAGSGMVDAGRTDAGDDEERILATGGGGCNCNVPGSPTGRGGGLLLGLAVLGLLALRRRNK